MTRLTIDDLNIERADPLEFEMADGTVYGLQDPKALPVDLMVNFEELPVIDQVQALITDGKWNEFTNHPEVDGYFYEALMKRYSAHFGLGDLGNAGGSSPSSNGTGKRSRPTSRGRVTPSRRSSSRAAGGTSST